MVHYGASASVPTEGQEMTVLLGRTPVDRLAKFARVWSSRGSALRGDTVQAMETGEDGESELNVSDILAVLSDRADLLAALKLAVDLVDRDIIRVRGSDRDELLSALEKWNDAIAKATGAS
jgi:hypothetical protein